MLPNICEKLTKCFLSQNLTLHQESCNCLSFFILFLCVYYLFRKDYTNCKCLPRSLMFRTEGSIILHYSYTDLRKLVVHQRYELFEKSILHSFIVK